MSDRSVFCLSPARPAIPAALALAASFALFACSAAPAGSTPDVTPDAGNGGGGAPGAGVGGNVGSTGATFSTDGITCTPQLWDAAPTGWATQGGGTTGGGSVAPVTVSTLAELSNAVGNAIPAVVYVSGKIAGSVSIGQNKTILGLCGAELDGHIQIGASRNVIIRNLKVVGLNCTDNADCQAGADAVTIEGGAQRVWIDHCDISDGSDGNLDITQAADYVTVSWTKFWYSGRRAQGHQFSNLVGSSDTSTGDTGHLRVTWHHDWWGANVGERQPRVRFGQVHIFNNLYTSSGDNYCVGVGFFSNILTENNAFINVSDPIDSTDYSNADSIVVSRGNLYQGGSGQRADKGTAVFTPPYDYALDDAAGISAAVMAGAGVK